MISPLAYVDKEARIGANVTIHPFAYIDKNVEIGDNCTQVKISRSSTFRVLIRCTRVHRRKRSLANF